MIDTAQIEARMRVRNLTPGNISLILSRYGRRVTECEIRDILGGRAVPSWEHLVRIAIVLDCTPWDLIIKKEN